MERSKKGIYPCVFTAEQNEAFFLEGSKRSTNKILVTNNASIITDITQHHFELKKLYNYFRNNSDQFRADDVRIVEMESTEQYGDDNVIKKFVRKEKFNNNINIEKMIMINKKI